MNEKLGNDLKDIMKMLIDLPSIVYFSEKQFYLDDTIDKIAFVFSEAVRIQKKIQDGLIENRFTKNFIASIYNCACEMGISHLQLLDTLLRTLKITTAQHYVSRILIYNFLDIHNEKTIHNARKKDLTERVQQEYRNAVLYSSSKL
ncbi:hypothetical protein TSAR_006131 [Trichomalopsis sarcophagae]|uniref:Uncharacterized protein n=1 Tax=Trichomalopsis sarcophagae TaxID=543379 RepID=A0A232EWN4_9HYME|nr:hypothetical protein TSAR_006131 [Trichomalopsis sarcophagae]